MKTKYFNDFELEQARKLFVIDPFLAKDQMASYVIKYPNDKKGVLRYIEALLSCREYDEAEKLLLSFNPETALIKNDSKKMDNILERLLYIKTKYLIHNKRYQEVLELLNNNPLSLKFTNFRQVICYARCKLGEDPYEDENQYVFKQMKSYSLELFREHINKHIDGLSGEFDQTKSKFNEDFPVDLIISEILKLIPTDDYGFFKGIISDTYAFKYDYCGKDSNKVTDFFKVNVFHNTNEFITMCPSLNCEKLKYFDLNYLMEEKPNVRRLSQKEKFLRKYDIK